MNEPETYVDLDGYEVPLYLVLPVVRPLVTRLCRCAGRKPNSRSLTRWGCKLFAGAAADCGLPLGYMVRDPAFTFLEDLVARVRLARGLSAYSGFFWFVERMMRNGCPHKLARELDMPLGVVSAILADDRHTRAEDMSQFLIRLEGAHFILRIASLVPRPRRIRPCPLPPELPRPANARSRLCSYQLHYIGGPDDGRIASALLPYAHLEQVFDAVYDAEMDGDRPVMKALDDQTWEIKVYFQGYQTRPHQA